MNRRDKLLLTGAAALIVGLSAAAALMNDDPVDSPRVAIPDAPVFKDQKKLGAETLRKLSKIPQADEVPQEFKEAENYLLDRWGHMEDAGLSAPGIMPEGDMYFQDRRILRGLRGNGNPVYAKAYIRPQVFRGPVAKKNSEFNAGLDRNPSASMPGRTEAGARSNVLEHAKRAGSLSDVLRKKPGKVAADLADSPGSGFRTRGEGASLEDE